MTGETIPDKVLAGATVTANGIMVQTDENGKYDIEDLTMEPRDYVMVAVSYNGVSYNFIQNPEVSKRPKLDATPESNGWAKPGPERRRIDSRGRGCFRRHRLCVTVSAAGENPAIQPQKQFCAFIKRTDLPMVRRFGQSRKETEQTKNSGTFKFSIQSQQYQPGRRITYYFRAGQPGDGAVPGSE